MLIFPLSDSSGIQAANPSRRLTFSPCRSAGFIRFNPSSQVQLAAGREVHQDLTTSLHQTIFTRNSFLFFGLSRLFVNTSKTLHSVIACVRSNWSIKFKLGRLDAALLVLDSGWESALTHTLDCDAVTNVWVRTSPGAELIRTSPQPAGTVCCHWVFLICFLMTQYLQLTPIRLVKGQLIIS